MKKTLQFASQQLQRPLRLLEVIGNASHGGMENYIKSFLAQLPPGQFKVTAICPYESPFTEALRTLHCEAVYITPITDDPLWRSIQLTSEIAQLHQADVLHAHMPKAHLLAGLAACLTNRPVVAQIHGMEITAFEWSIARAVQSTLITNCQQAYAQALSLGAGSDQVTHIANGVDTELFQFTKEKRNDFRQKLGIAEDVPLIGFVGRLEKEKGADLFLLLAAQVHQHLSAAHFVMAGAGGLQEELVSQCRAIGMQDCFHFAGWQQDTAAIYPALDVLVQTTRSDGTSLVVLEAMACRVPVAALAVGGIPELVESGNTGVLAAPEDWEGLSRLLIHILENSGKLQQMGEAGRQRVLTHFNLSSQAARTVAVMQQAVLKMPAGQGRDADRDQLARQSATGI